MNKRIICFILFIFLIQPAFTREGSELTSEIYRNNEFRIRLSVFSEYFTLLFISKIIGYEDYDVVLGFSTPWISFGPMYRYGLFRELYNPLVYTPQSTVFREKSELRLSRAFGSGKRRFLHLSLFPGMCSFFLQTGENIPLFGGAHISTAIGDIYSQDLLASFSVPGRKKEKDEWYTDFNLFPGGTIYHLCMKSLVQIPGFNLSFTGSISGGDIIMPGFFINSSISRQQEWYALSFLFGYCSDYFITPDGLYKNRMMRTGSSLVLSPFSLFDIDLCYYFDMDHPSPLPGDYFCTTNTIAGKVNFKHYVQKEILIDLVLSGNSTISFDKLGGKAEEHEITFLTGLYSTNFSGKSTLSLPLDQGNEIIPEWMIELSFSGCAHSFSLHNTLFTGNDLSWKGGLEYRADINHCEVRLAFSCKKPIPLTGSANQTFMDNPFDFILFTLSFNVRQEHAVL